MQIPAEALTAINAVIENDEGGWVLTSNANDPDGGWTYAGVTAKTFEEYRKEAWPQFPPLQKHELEEIINNEDKLATFKDSVYEIYYTKYYLPLQHNYGDVTREELSCAVNCGPDTAINIYHQSALSHIPFGHQWLLHYAELVRKNAEAWQRWAQLLYSHYLGDAGALKEIAQHPELKPSLLRAETLAGWINRVEKYR